MSEYFGKYRGVPVYKVSFEEFFNMESSERRNPQKIWMINEDKKVIRNGQVFGVVNEKTKRLDEVKPLDYKSVYARQIDEFGRKERERIISERKAVEAMATEGAQKLKTVVRESEAKVAEVVTNGEVRLNALAEEGARKARKVRQQVKKEEGEA